MSKQSSLWIVNLLIITLVSTGCAWSNSLSSPVITPIAITIPTPTRLIKPTPTTILAPSPTTTLPPPSASPTKESLKTIIVGSNSSTEQLLLAKILILALQEAGYEITDQTGIPNTDLVRQGLEEGEIDLYWEYVGRALSVIHKLEPVANDRDASLTILKTLDEARGLVWFDPLPFNTTYTLMIEASNVAQGLVTLDNLAAFMNENDAPLTLCVVESFIKEPNGLSALQDHYDFEFREENILQMKQDEIYEALQEGKCEVAGGYTTDGHVAASSFHVLSDSRQFFYASHAAPVARQVALDHFPELASHLTLLAQEIGPRLDDHTMGVLNACVDIGPDGLADSGDERSVEEVAEAFFNDDLINCLPPRIVVSSHNVAPESVWAGKMFVYLLKEAGYDVIDKTGLGPPPVMRKAMLAEEIDLYWEAVSFALMLFHGVPPAAFPADSARSFTLAKSLDQPLGITWLKRADQVKFASMLVVRDETYQTGIRTIEDLATFMNENDSPLKICTNASVSRRPDGIPGIEAFYGFKFKPENIIITDNLADESFTFLRDRGCDVAHGLTTDNLEAWDFQILEDNHEFFPPFTPAPVIRQAVLDQYPELAEIIEQASDFLSDKGMNELNRLLEVGRDGEPDSGDEESMDTIARLALCQDGLLDDCSGIPKELLVVTTDEPERACEEIVLNGSFEDEEDSKWVLPVTARQPEYAQEIVHSGKKALRLGNVDQKDDLSTHSVTTQKILIPNSAKSATLTFWYYPISVDAGGGDYHGALVYNSDVSFIRRKLLREISNDQAWTLETHDLSALRGEYVNLYFYVESDGDQNASGMYLDDVSVEVCYGGE